LLQLLFVGLSSSGLLHLEQELSSNLLVSVLEASIFLLWTIRERQKKEREAVMRSREATCVVERNKLSDIFVLYLFLFTAKPRYGAKRRWWRE
jgi:hypothetical protein